MTSGGFSANPFDLANANVRAGNTDRDELARILSVAYADGKLDDEEYAERLDAAMEIKLLGEARTLLIDLGSPKQLLHRPPTKGEVEADVRRVGRIRRGAYVAAFGGWAALTVLFNVIWLLTVIASGEPQYYWPIWPMLGLGIGAIAAGTRAKQRRLMDGRATPRSLPPGRDR